MFLCGHHSSFSGRIDGGEPQHGDPVLLQAQGVNLRRTGRIRTEPEEQRSRGRQELFRRAQKGQVRTWRGGQGSGLRAVEARWKGSRHGHPKCPHRHAFSIIRYKVRPDSIVYTDSVGAFDVLDVSEFHHVRINHSELFAKDVNYINGVEIFWN